MNLFELLIILDVIILSEEVRCIDVDKDFIVFCMYCKNICMCIFIFILIVLIKNYG